MRWSANFTPVLEKRNCKVNYQVDPSGRERVTVEVQDGDDVLEIPWKQYLKDYVDETMHQTMRDNILLATRNFQHRVETFRREVIFGRNNPMRVRHISYRVEFQGRGAAHIHGVLWLDLKELKVEGVQNFVLQEAYTKLRHSQPLEVPELRALEKFTDAFVTCTRSVGVAGEEAVRIAEETNWHGHSSSCKKGGGRLCRWKFPRYPLARTIFVDANREDKEEQRMDEDVREDILNRVVRVLVKDRGNQKVLRSRVTKIMLSYPNVKKIPGAVISDSSSDEEEELTPFRLKRATKNPPSPSIHSEVKNPNPPSPVIHPEAPTPNSPSPAIHRETSSLNPPAPSLSESSSEEEESI